MSAVVAQTGAAPADPCNNFTTCSDCIGSHTTGGTCGWCTGQISSAGSTASYQCAGRGTTSTPGFTCQGHFQTSSCEDPGGCGLEGTFRGLRIDNLYGFGEWQATFASRNNSEDVTIKQLDATGKATTSVEGSLKCDKECKKGTTDKGVNFTLTTTAGDILHGICGFTQQYQAETSGLMWAISNKGIGKAPTGFDAAMVNTSNATVFTYYKCADFKKKECSFTPV